MYVTRCGAADGIIARATRLGVEPARLAVAAALDPAPRRWMTCAQLLSLHEGAARLSGDDAFGLHLAEELSLESFGAMGRGVATAATFGEAMGHAVRHLRGWTNGAEISLRPAGAAVRLEYRMREPTLPSRHDAEATLGMFLVFARMAGIRDAPREVAFAHRRPARTTEHDRLFAAPVRFESAVDSLLFDRSWLDCRLPAMNAADLTPESAATPPLTLPARVAIEAATILAAGECGLGVVARRLAMSERTLQRRLSDHGTSFESVVDDLRRQLALQYLNGREHTVGEMASRLGFAHRSPFIRAFRRWTGTTPSGFLDPARSIESGA